LSRYTHHSILASLGCPHRCAFCCNYTGTVLRQGVTVRRADTILEELRYLVDRFAARQVFFVDDVFLLARENVLRFCRRLAAERLPIEWVAQMRADLVDDEVAEALAAAECRRIYLGVEAGSEAILRRAGKRIDRRTTLRAVQAAKAAGIRVKTGWVVGLPGTLEEQYESVSFMSDLRPHEISIHQLIPFPGTDYYARPEKHGLRIRDPKDFASFCFGGLGDNVSFDYLSRRQLVTLLEDTVAALESQGYVSSDRATPGDEYIFTTPLSALSLSVFRAAG
jgi:anaerobic magnesium-protoporphyrin IX monomethyl ester cyclase